MPSVLHSSDSDSWGSPSLIVDAARDVMGGIDLDPASSAVANLTVKASRIYTVEDDGLSRPWRGRVFLNPPGGQVNAFWLKWLASLTMMQQGIWVGFSLEQLQTLQQVPDASHTPLHFHLCFPARRIQFVETVEMKAARKARCLARGKAFTERSTPSHANYIAYYGSRPARFAKVFSALGQVILK